MPLLPHPSSSVPPLPTPSLPLPPLITPTPTPTPRWVSTSRSAPNGTLRRPTSRRNGRSSSRGPRRRWGPAVAPRRPAARRSTPPAAALGGNLRRIASAGCLGCRACALPRAQPAELWLPAFASLRFKPSRVFLHRPGTVRLARRFAARWCRPQHRKCCLAKPCAPAVRVALPAGQPCARIASAMACPPRPDCAGAGA